MSDTDKRMREALLKEIPFEPKVLVSDALTCLVARPRMAEAYNLGKVK
jgi:hypothetical protein